MKERMEKVSSDLKEFWSSRTKQQKVIYIGSLLGILLVAGLLTYFLSRTTYVPLYTDISSSEVGRIKEELDARGVDYQIAPGGTSILVPEKQADDLLVTLAAEGYPQSGAIDYSVFAENSGFGTTDNEFNMLKVATLQTELANLLKGVEGVQDAKVMITLPTQSVFVSEQTEDATAAIVLKTQPNHEFTEDQMRAMYQLVSKSLPKLTPENISIMNQYFEYYDFEEHNSSGVELADHRSIKRSIEQDIQREVQKMLGMLVGQDKVVVSVSTDIDFKQENREENIVEPVDEDNMEGIAISMQRITETYSGEDAGPGGQLEGEDPTDNNTNYVEAGVYGNGDYERTEDNINNEVNRIRKEIIESPYKIRDLGIQVLLEPPLDEDGEVDELPVGLEDDVEQILATIIRTSIDEGQMEELTDTDIEDKIAVSIQPFNGQFADFEQEGGFQSIPWWVYAIGGVLVLIIGGLVYMFFRKKKEEEAATEEALEEQEEETISIKDINEEQETEESLRREQLEKMAKEQPEEIAKILRTWISADC